MNKYTLLKKQFICFAVALIALVSYSFAQVNIQALDALKGMQVGDDVPLFHLENLR